LAIQRLPIAHYSVPKKGEFMKNRSILVTGLVIVSLLTLACNQREQDLSSQAAVNTRATGKTTTHTYSTVGNYQVSLTVTDSDGNTGSVTKTVMVSDSDCPMELVGFATVDGGTTGGGDATPIRVTTIQELYLAVQGNEPRVVVVSGTMATMDHPDVGGWPMEIGSNKTIVGADRNATIIGGLTVNGQSNVIIRNLNIQGVYPNSGPGDTLSSKNSHHIWWDHLAVWDAEDGLLDITRESDYQTVSWSKFYYTKAENDHRLASLNGSGGGDHPEDWGHLRITYHHNWWGELVDQRMPRVMYGQGHQFNNYFNSTGNSYCIGVGSYGSVLIENNYFKDVNNPHQFMYDVYMYAAAEGNIYDNTTGSRDVGLGGTRDAAGQEAFDPGPFTPPYAYDLDPADTIPQIVMRCAGPQ
jgi:pectate lyase